MSERDETREAVARAILNRRIKPDFRTVIDGAWIVDHDLELADATLTALRPGSRFTVEGVECVVVRKDALDWLNGEGDSFERPDNVRGNFWWRGEFKRRAMLRACEQKGDGR